MAIKMISFAGIGEVACIANGVCQTYCGKCAVRTGKQQPTSVRTLIERLNCSLAFIAVAASSPTAHVLIRREEAQAVLNDFSELSAALAAVPQQEESCEGNAVTGSSESGRRGSAGSVAQSLEASTDALAAVPPPIESIRLRVFLNAIIDHGGANSHVWLVAEAREQLAALAAVETPQRKQFGELRARMSPEAQEGAAQRTADMLVQMGITACGLSRAELHEALRRLDEESAPATPLSQEREKADGSL